jgi:hypothetical protein
MRLMSRHALALVVTCSLAGTGCAARFDGDVDNKPVPSFGSAAFGTSTTTGFFGVGGRVHVVIGTLMPGDSCADGAELFKRQRRLEQAENDVERQDRAEDLADTINERLPEDSWYAQLTLTAPDDDDLDDTDIDLGRQQGIAMQLLLCERSGEAAAVDGRLEVDDDCYRAVDGDVVIDRSEDERQLFLTSDGGVDFNDEGGRDEGELEFSMTLGECEDLTNEVERVFPPG